MHKGFLLVAVVLPPLFCDLKAFALKTLTVCFQCLHLAKATWVFLWQGAYKALLQLALVSQVR